jgi:hypothetical protein
MDESQTPPLYQHFRNEDLDFRFARHRNMMSIPVTPDSQHDLVGRPHHDSDNPQSSTDLRSDAFSIPSAYSPFGTETGVSMVSRTYDTNLLFVSDSDIQGAAPLQIHRKSGEIDPEWASDGSLEICYWNGPSQAMARRPSSVHQSLSVSDAFSNGSLPKFDEPGFISVGNESVMLQSDGLKAERDLTTPSQYRTRP